MDTLEESPSLRDVSGPIDDLALTLPVFLGYHLGVAFLPVRNAADLVTHELVRFAENSLAGYIALTVILGLGYAAVLLVLGREQHLRWERFALVLFEGILYAVAMRLVAGYVIGKMSLAAVDEAATPLAALVTSLGAGFYEELVFRVLGFGLGLKLVYLLFATQGRARRFAAGLAWALVTALVFSGWHYVGEFGDPFELRSFVFRAVCGLVFVAIYALRGFAPVVWTHALYDIWVLVLPGFLS
ncbi:MAG: CPBP family glutamic-type intramembrane protease [Myxococcota bacterium]|jgi:Type II CAAX prenyl endopeptidase Rce1-like|nr:CPBP family glutamic-type intramembrane protease [Myxococcota bacterium]